MMSVKDKARQRRTFQFLLNIPRLLGVEYDPTFRIPNEQDVGGCEVVILVVTIEDGVFGTDVRRWC